MKKLVSLLLACVMVLGLLVGCGKQETATEEQTTATTTETTTTETTTTEEAVATETTSDPNETEYYVIDANSDTTDTFDTVWWNPTDLCRLMLFDRLLQVDAATGEINVPQLAERFTVSDDGLTYTFVLRDNVKWHDGEAFTAEDVVWSIETALKATMISANLQTQLLGIEGAQAYVDGTADSVSGVTADGNTVTIVLSVYSNQFLDAISTFAPLPKHLLEGADPATIHTHEFWQAPVGTGAYQFNEFVVGEYFTFVRNEDYYGNKAVIKNVKALIIDAADYVVKTQANEIDYIQTRDAATIEEVLLNTNYTGTEFPVVYYRSFAFNTRGYNGATDGTRMSDVNVRKALSHALDIPAICEAVYGDYATPLTTLCPPAINGYAADAEYCEYDPEKARTMLEEAGFDFSQPIRILEYFGDPATYDLLDLVVWYYDQIGVKCEYFNAGSDAVAAIYDVRDYDLMLSASNYGNNRNLLYSGLTNTMSYRADEDTELDNLYNELCVSVSFEAQTAVFQELQRTESKYQFEMPLCTLRYFAMVNTAKLNTEGVNFLGDGFNYDRGFDKLSFNPDYFD